MLLIRSFETALMRHPDHGFQLLSSGEEAVAVGVCAVLNEHDQLLSSGRSIGPALARGLAPGAVMAELLGRVDGPCQGRGGRGHLAHPAAGFFGAHAVVGGNITIAAGVALAKQSRRERGIVACIFGDGACGAGALHESLNIAALWRLPLFFVCDNNQLSVSTPASEALAPQRLSDLAAPYGIPRMTVDGMDVDRVSAAAGELVRHVRGGGGPAFLECLSERFASHSTSSRETRGAAVLAAARARCPIERHARALVAAGTLSAAAVEALRREVDGVVDDALRHAEASPLPAATEVLRNVL